MFNTPSATTRFDTTLDTGFTHLCIVCRREFRRWRGSTGGGWKGVCVKAVASPVASNGKKNHALVLLQLRRRFLEKRRFLERRRFLETRPDWPPCVFGVFQRVFGAKSETFFGRFFGCQAPASGETFFRTFFFILDRARVTTRGWSRGGGRGRGGSEVITGATGTGVEAGARVGGRDGQGGGGLVSCFNI